MNSLSIKTFGSIHSTTNVKAETLFLLGQKVWISHPFHVKKLNLAGVDGVTNMPEGQLHIGEQVNILRGHFLNQGRIFGNPNSILDLHGNDYTNMSVAQDPSSLFKTKLNFKGLFSVKNVRNLIHHTFVSLMDPAIVGDLRVVSTSVLNRKSIEGSLLDFNCQEDLTNLCLIRGLTSLSFTVRVLLNSKEIQAPGALKLAVRQDLSNEKGARITGKDLSGSVLGTTTNFGEFSFQTFLLETRHLQNHHLIKIFDKGVLGAIAGIGHYVNLATGRMTSLGSIEFIGGSLRNQATKKARGQIQAPTLSATMAKGPDADGLLENEADMIATTRGDLEAEILHNTKSGVFRLPVGHVSGTLVDNEGKFLGDDLFFATRQLMRNLLSALIKTSKLLKVSGARLENKGDLTSQGDIEGSLMSIDNSNRMTASNEIRVRTGTADSAGAMLPHDFVNSKLMEALDLVLQVVRGLNRGAAKEGEHKGLLGKRTVKVETVESFDNDGLMQAPKLIEFTGTGTGRNGKKGLMDTEGEFSSTLPSFENDEGQINAGKMVRFDKLTGPLYNNGGINSDGDMAVRSLSTVINYGQFHTTLGELLIDALELLNYFQIDTHEGLLKIKVTRGENHNLLFGFGGIVLTIAELFTNFAIENTELGLLESRKSVAVNGDGTLVNKASVKAAEDVNVSTGLENSGKMLAGRNVAAESDGKNFVVTKKGEIVSSEDLSLKNTRQVTIKGHMEGATTSVVSLGDLAEFFNSGVVMARDGKGFYHLQRARNLGTLYSKTELELAIVNFVENLHQIQSALVLIHGGGKFHNFLDGTVKADTMRLLGILLLNAGGLYAENSLELSDLLGTTTNEESGEFISENELIVRNLAFLLNAGLFQGKNRAALAVTHLQNKGKILSPAGTIDCTLDTGTNEENAAIQARDEVTLSIGNSLENSGDVGSKKISFRGDGTLNNKKVVHAAEEISYALPSITNSKDFVSNDRLIFTGINDLSNLADGNIHSAVLTLTRVVNLTNHGKFIASSLSPEAESIRIERLINTGVFYISNGALKLNLGTGENSGKLAALTLLRIFLMESATPFQNTEPAEMIGENVAFEGPNPFINKGPVKAVSRLVYKAGKLSNKNTIAAKEKVSIHQDMENGENGLIHSPGTVDLLGTEESTNAGDILGEEGITAQYNGFETSGLFESPKGTVDVTVHHGWNKGVITEEQRKTLGGKKVVLRIGERFANKGDIWAEDSFEAKGDGVFSQEGRLFSKGSASLQNKTVLNSGPISAENNITIGAGTTVKNAETGKIQSKTHIEVNETADVENKGAFLSDKTITFNQPTVSNDGKILAKESVSFPKCKTLINGVHGKIASVSEESGALLFPVLENLTNLGDILSRQALNFALLRSLFTKGTIFTHDVLTIILPGDFSPEGTLTGLKGVILKIGGVLNNKADVTSDGTVDAIAQAFKNMKTISGKKGVSVKAETTLENADSSKIQSREGKVKLEANNISNASTAEISGKDVEYVNHGSVLTEGGKTTAENNLTYTCPHGWKPKGNPAVIGSNFTLTGPILGDIPITISGDFAWKGLESLSNNFKISVQGVFTIHMTGAWIVMAHVEAMKGSNITAASFTNNATFLSYVSTVFNCTQGVTNNRAVKLFGAVDFQIPNGSLVNSPGANLAQRGHDSTINLNVGGDVAAYASYVSLEGNLKGKIGKKLIVRSEVESTSFMEWYSGYIVKTHKFNDSCLKAGKWREPCGKYSIIWTPISAAQYSKMGGKKYLQSIISGTRLLSKKPAVFVTGSADIVVHGLENYAAKIMGTRFFKVSGVDLYNESFESNRLHKVHRRFRKKHKLRQENGTYKKSRHEYRENNLSPKDSIAENNVEALISSWGVVTANFTGSKTGKGRIQGFDVTLQIPGYADGVAASSTAYHRNLPNTDCLESYNNEVYDGRGFYSLNTGQTTSSAVVPVYSYTPLTAAQRNEQLDPTHYHFMVSETGKTTQFLDFVRQQFETTWAERGMGKTRRQLRQYNLGKAQALQDCLNAARGIPVGWEPSPAHVDSYRHTLDSNLSARIAALDHPSLRGGLKPRTHNHPSLAGELLQKSMVARLGVSSISRGIQTPELLLRVLEEEGYIQARELHGLSPVSARADWNNLSPREQLLHQMIELLSMDEVKGFKNPAIVYKLIDFHGELVLSAMMHYPPHIIEAFSNIFGRAYVLANKLHVKTQGNIETTQTVAHRDGGSLESENGNIKVKDVFSGGDFKVDAKNDFHAFGTVVAPRESILSVSAGSIYNDLPTSRLEAGTTLLNSRVGSIHNWGLIKGHKYLQEISAGDIVHHVTRTYKLKGRHHGPIPIYTQAKSVGGTGIEYTDANGQKRLLGLMMSSEGRIYNQAGGIVSTADIFMEARADGEAAVHHDSVGEYYLAKEKKKRGGVFGNKKKRIREFKTATANPTVLSLNGKIVTSTPNGGVRYTGAKAVGKDGDVIFGKGRVEYHSQITNSKKIVEKSSLFGLNSSKIEVKEQAAVATVFVNSGPVEHTSINSGIYGRGVEIYAPSYTPRAKKEIRFEDDVLEYSVRQKNRALMPTFFGSGALSGQPLGKALIKSDPLGSNIYELAHATEGGDKLIAGISAAMDLWNTGSKVAETLNAGGDPTNILLSRVANVGLSYTRTSLRIDGTRSKPSVIDVGTFTPISETGVDLLGGTQARVGVLFNPTAPYVKLGHGKEEVHTRFKSTGFEVGYNFVTETPNASVSGSKSKSDTTTYRNALVQVGDGGHVDLSGLGRLELDGGNIITPTISGHVPEVVVKSYQDRVDSRSSSYSVGGSGFGGPNPTGSASFSRSSAHSRTTNQHSGITATNGFGQDFSIDRLTVTDTTLDPALAATARKVDFVPIYDSKKSKTLGITLSNLNLSSTENFSNSLGRSTLVMGAGFGAAEAARRLGAGDFGTSLAGTLGSAAMSYQLNGTSFFGDASDDANTPGLSSLGTVTYGRNGKTTTFMALNVNGPQLAREWGEIQNLFAPTPVSAPDFGFAPHPYNGVEEQAAEILAAQLAAEMRKEKPVVQLWDESALTEEHRAAQPRESSLGDNTDRSSSKKSENKSKATKKESKRIIVSAGSENVDQKDKKTETAQSDNNNYGTLHVPLSEMRRVYRSFFGEPPSPSEPDLERRCPEMVSAHKDFSDWIYNSSGVKEYSKEFFIQGILRTQDFLSSGITCACRTVAGTSVGQKALNLTANFLNVSQDDAMTLATMSPLFMSMTKGPSKAFKKVSSATVIKKGLNPRRAANHNYEFNMVTNPGPLSEIKGNPARNFAGGRYSATIVKEDTLVYRAGHSRLNPSGEWFSLDIPQSATQVRIDKAVRLNWVDPVTGSSMGSSPMNGFHVFKVKPGAKIYSGPVGNQGSSFVGGSGEFQRQLYIPRGSNELEYTGLFVPFK